MSFIQPSDFVSPYAIPTFPANTTHVQTVINDWEDYYMTLLFGSEMYVEYVEGLLLPSPDNAIWLKLKNPFIEQEECHIMKSDGIKKMLLGFIYWHYYQPDSIKANFTGQIVEKAENSMNIDPTAKNATLFNKSVSTFEAIQCYVKLNKDDYPNFKGKEDWFYINPFF